MERTVVLILNAMESVSHSRREMTMIMAMTRMIMIGKDDVRKG